MSQICSKICGAQSSNWVLSAKPNNVVESPKQSSFSSAWVPEKSIDGATITIWVICREEHPRGLVSEITSPAEKIPDWS